MRPGFFVGALKPFGMAGAAPPRQRARQLPTSLLPFRLNLSQAETRYSLLLYERQSRGRLLSVGFLLSRTGKKQMLTR